MVDEAGHQQKVTCDATLTPPPCSTHNPLEYIRRWCSGERRNRKADIVCSSQSGNSTAEVGVQVKVESYSN